VISARDPSGHRGQAPVQALPARDPSGERTPSRLALGALAQVRALALRRQVVLPPAPPRLRREAGSPRCWRRSPRTRLVHPPSPPRSEAPPGGLRALGRGCGRGWQLGGVSGEGRVDGPVLPVGGPLLAQLGFEAAHAVAQLGYQLFVTVPCSTVLSHAPMLVPCGGRAQPRGSGEAPGGTKKPHRLPRPFGFCGGGARGRFAVEDAAETPRGALPKGGVEC
jgi:hypothetical protein